MAKRLIVFLTGKGSEAIRSFVQINLLGFHFTWRHVLQNMPVHELLPVRPARDLCPEHVAHLGPLQLLPLLVDGRAGLGRGHQALLHQGRQGAADHQFHFQGWKNRGNALNAGEICAVAFRLCVSR